MVFKFNESAPTKRKTLEGWIHEETTVFYLRVITRALNEKIVKKNLLVTMI